MNKVNLQIYKTEVMIFKAFLKLTAKQFVFLLKPFNDRKISH